MEFRAGGTCGIVDEAGTTGITERDLSADLGLLLGPKMGDPGGS